MENIMNKNIGILTYHHVMNDGAILQAYSQAKTIQECLDSYEVDIINYRIKAVEIEEFKSYFYRPILRFDISRIKRYVHFKKFINHELPLSYEGLISDDYEKAIRFVKDKYDVIIVGSDEVWKSICESGRTKRPFPNIYWLSPELNCKKIAMAASANRCDYRKISKKNREIGRKLLQDFDFLGVRDQHTVDFVSSLGICDKEVHKVPDPTFSFELTEDYHKTVKNKLTAKGLNLNEPILCFRTGTGSGEKDNLCKKATQYFKDRGYQTMSIGGYNRYADHNLGHIFNPFEWAHVYKFFDFCITDRFHGTIFSLKNGTPFLSIEDDEYYKRIRSKIVDLLEDFSMMHHYLYMDGSDYDLNETLKNIENTFSKKDVRHKVENMRIRYYDMLDVMGKLI